MIDFNIKMALKEAIKSLELDNKIEKTFEKVIRGLDFQEIHNQNYERDGYDFTECLCETIVLEVYNYEPDIDYLIDRKSVV